MINIFQPNLGNEEIKEIKKVFASNWIGRGDQVKKFETNFAAGLSSDPKKFHATTSCTEGIFLSSEIFNFSEKDEIIVPSISFIACGSAVVNSGAKLVICDVDKHTLNATAELIQRKITKHTKAVILNHYGGFPCDMEPIMELARVNDIIVIEDSACAVKSFYKGKACGTIGDMGVWSFDAMKAIVTGDGGMIYLNSEILMTKAKELLYLGLSPKEKSGLDKLTSGNEIWWDIEINAPGRRAIMNNVSAAMGLAQLAKLDKAITRRKQINEIYSEQLKDLDWMLIPPEIDKDSTSSYYFYWVQTKFRNKLANYLKDNGVYTTFRYWPLNRVKYFNLNENNLSNSDYATDSTLNIPTHPGLMETDITKIVDLLRKFRP